MKKYFMFFSIALIIFSCTPEKDPNIALITWRGETAAEQGFKDGLTELGHKVTFKQFDAGQDKENLQTILENDLLPNIDKYDLVYTFGTTTSLIVKDAVKNQVPQIFNIVLDPVKAGLVSKLEASGNAISGVSNYIPIDIQINNARKVFPFSKLAVLYNELEENSQITLEKIKSISAEFEFEVVPVPITPAENELTEALKSLADKTIEADAVYFPADSYVVSNAEIIVEELNKAKIKSIGAIEKYLEAGALVGTITDYYQLGKLAAAIFDKHQKSEKLENIPVQKSDNPKLMINKATCDLFGISISDELQNEAEFIK